MKNKKTIFDILKNNPVLTALLPKLLYLETVGKLNKSPGLAKGILVLTKISLLIFAVLITGCRTEYFKDKAADKARDYIFENYPKMSPQNANFIKYTYPSFLSSPISTTLGAADPSQYYWNFGNNYFNPAQFSRSRELSQVAIAWDLTSPNATIMVIGTCYDNYWSWDPLRLIIRERDTLETKKRVEANTSAQKVPDKVEGKEKIL